MNIYNNSININNLNSKRSKHTSTRTSTLRLRPMMSLQQIKCLMRTTQMISMTSLLTLTMTNRLSSTIRLSTMPILTTTHRNSFNNSTNNNRTPNNRFSNIRIPLIITNNVKRLTYMCNINMSTITINRHTRIPIPIHLLTINSTPMSTTSISTLNKILIFKLIMRMSTLTKFRMYMTTNHIRSLISTISRINSM